MGLSHQKVNLLLLLQRFDVSACGKDPEVDEPALVGAGTISRDILDLDTHWEAFKCDDAARAH